MGSEVQAQLPPPPRRDEKEQRPDQKLDQWTGVRSWRSVHAENRGKIERRKFGAPGLLASDRVVERKEGLPLDPLGQAYPQDLHSVRRDRLYRAAPSDGFAHPERPNPAMCTRTASLP